MRKEQRLAISQAFDFNWETIGKLLGMNKSDLTEAEQEAVAQATSLLGRAQAILREMKG